VISKFELLYDSQMRTEISLVGGLGNQLFIVAYALFRKHIQNHEVTLREVKSGRHNRTHGSFVVKELDGKLGIPEKSGWTVEHLLMKASRFLSAKLRPWKGSGHNVTYMHEGEMIGRLPSIRPLAIDTFETGYFQNPKFMQAIQELGFFKELRPRNPSDWYLTTVSANYWEGALAVHVRRGDFSGKKGPGALGLEYYREAIELSLAKSDNKTIVVFSDAIDEVEELFLGALPQHHFVFVDPPSDSSAIESLHLLSRFQSIVISNSTFSWWAAVTGDSKKSVVAPESWSRSEPQAITLNLESWTLVRSSWAPQT